MEQRRIDSSKMRVAVVSASQNQREHLKRLIEACGPKVIGVSGFRDFNATMVGQKPDVLLIDLDQADDAALERMEKMVEQSKIPILFNESTAIPMMPGPYRDDWVDNLVGKLYSLAQKHDVPAAPALLDRPRYSNTTARHALPKVLVVSHSKTRRRVLQIILASQAIKESAETSYREGFSRDNLKAYDVLLLDEHNVGPEDAAIFEELLAQSDVPVQLCNSSHIPHAPSERNQWGMKLAGQLIKLSRSVVADKAAVKPAQETKTEGHWGERIASALSDVRETIKNAPSLHESVAVPKAMSDTLAGNTTKTSARPASPILRGTTKQNDPGKDLKYRPPAKTAELNIPAGTKTNNEASDAAYNAKSARPVDHFAKRGSSTAGVGEIVDANNIGTIANSNAAEKSVASLTQEERDAEIARFFNFDTQPGDAAELTIEPIQKTPAATPSTQKKKVAPLPRKQTVADAGPRSKKLIKQWFQSLAGIRQKLPKLFH